jgi:hypothetical protein
MKKRIILSGLLIATMAIVSCNSNKEQKAEEQTSIQANVPKDEPSPEGQISVEEIDKLRAEIESFDIKPIEISTSTLREKIKQKWSKIHFYLKDSVIVKVKTYPHPSISKRTEEFYANKDGLLMVVIEDNGSAAKNQEKDMVDKMYYFNGDSLIKETNKGTESEYNVRNSDAEELMTEFKEYLDIYKKSKK